MRVQDHSYSKFIVSKMFIPTAVQKQSSKYVSVEIEQESKMMKQKILLSRNFTDQAVSICCWISSTTSSFKGTTFFVKTGVVPGRYLYFGFL